MGGSSSKDESKAQTQNKIVETSNGTHLFELHIPTMGFGATFIILTLFVVAIVWWIIKKKMPQEQPQASIPHCLLQPGPLQHRNASLPRPTSTTVASGGTLPNL